MTYGDACNRSVKEIGRTYRRLIGQRNVAGENTGEIVKRHIQDWTQTT
jgi:hypothetical protein